MLSVVIPAHNEEGCIEETLRELTSELGSENVKSQIVVVDDNSTDSTPQILSSLQKELPELHVIKNLPPNGFGLAIRKGLFEVKGDYVAIMMADLSDSPKDLIRFYREAEKKNLDAVFGNRFSKGGKAEDYPRFKWLLNRFTNSLIALLFGIRYRDVTNAFKLYKTSALKGLEPYLSHHFNLTVELPLKIIVRGYSYSVLPNSWKNRKAGKSKLKIKEMGSRYWFIIFWECLLIHCGVLVFSYLNTEIKEGK